MTTVAYCAVSPGGRTEGKQIWLRPEAVPGLRRLTDAIHAEGAAISAQIGHAGPVANARSNKAKAYAPVRFFNPLSMRFAKKATRDDIDDIIDGARQRRAAGDRGRLRRRRDPPGPQLLRQLVPQPADQPPRRRVRRIAGEPRQGRARHGDGGAPGRGEGGHADRGDRQAQHGRRRPRRHLDRRVAADGQVAGGGRRPGRHRTHRGQLAGQPDVPVPRRRPDQGVRRRVQAAAALGHPDDRARSSSASTRTARRTCCATPSSSAPS